MDEESPVPVNYFFGWHQCKGRVPSKELRESLGLDNIILVLQ